MNVEFNTKPLTLESLRHVFFMLTPPNPVYDRDLGDEHKEPETSLVDYPYYLDVAKGFQRGMLIQLPLQRSSGHFHGKVSPLWWLLNQHMYRLGNPRSLIGPGFVRHKERSKPIYDHDSGDECS